MANEERRPMLNNQETAEGSREKVSQELKREEQKQEIDRKLRNLYSRYQVAVQRQDPAAKMLASLINIVCKVRSLNEKLDAVAYAMETVHDCFEFTRTTLAGINEIMEIGAKGRAKTGFGRFLEKRKTKRRARNFVAALTSQLRDMNSMVEVIPDIANTLDNELARMGDIFDKSEQKAAKKRKKKGLPAQTGTLSPEALGTLSDMGIEVNVTDNGTTEKKGDGNGANGSDTEDVFGY